MDDILVYGSTPEEHNQRLEEALQRLVGAGLTLNLEKCEFDQTSIRFYGYMLDAEGVYADPSKIQRSLTCPSVKMLLTFAGFWV